ncbi:MAG: hypothetical protein IPQ04_10230 [Saprospiraceae bacterium]|nr:hypothetical protein [Saprospiraceae bacterium]
MHTADIPIKVGMSCMPNIVNEWKQKRIFTDPFHPPKSFEYYVAAVVRYIGAKLKPTLNSVANPKYLEPILINFW